MKYKVGDIVRIVNNASGHGFEIGTKVRIKSLDNNWFFRFLGITEKAEYLDGSDFWWITNKDIEPC